MGDAAYAKETRNTVRRHRERGIYDYATVHSIVNQTSILHVSFLPTDPSDDPFPTILPMIGTMGLFTQPDNDPGAQPLDLYIHGHSASRLMRLPTAQGLEQIPVCVAATLIDGIKLALTPFNHSCNYRSVVIHGYASIVTDEAEKNWALALITDGLVPNRWDNSRVPPTKAEMTSTTVLKVSVVSASAKVSTGEPGNDRKDLKDESVTSSVWTGVLPVYETIGAPLPSSTNKVAKVPQYLDQWWQSENKKRETYAHGASQPK
ncbi:hypothetical protein HDK77DRAFT_85402 [Phyllosticta capitalensis]|uniref:Flavin-nucleotide-binding protein n=1 Tax=Phyllosticta capitalensis TaxID=121624 RepID=A0ABR1YF63_9PEZI